MRILKFLALVVLLNLVRYVVGRVVERPAVTRLLRVVESYPAVFNNNFTTFDWVTSYFYNFMMWLTAAWVFALLAPSLRGHYMVRSLKVFGLMLLFFVSLSAIYVNHYIPPKAFYLGNPSSYYPLSDN